MMYGGESTTVEKARTAVVFGSEKARPEIRQDSERRTVVHILWDGHVGGIQHLVKRAFLDDSRSSFRHVAIVASEFGSVIGPGDCRFCLGMRSGWDILRMRRMFHILKQFSNAVLVYHLITPVFRMLAPRSHPIIILEHGCTAVRSNFRFINTLLGQAMYKRASMVVCVSRNSRITVNALVPRHAAKSVVVQNPVLISFGEPRVFPRQPATVGFIGRFSPEKGPMEFIQCARHLLEKALPVRFKMVGGGPLLPECEDFARRIGVPIEFTGFVNDISPELASMDVLAVSSSADAFNMAIIEAMARGVPVAAFPVGGIPEIITHDRTGLLAAAKSPRDLALSVERILFENELYPKLSLNAFGYVRDHYRLKEYRKKWETIFSRATVLVHRGKNSL
jgi:glycosyltransferase involved in cell wall biosynthesis